MLAGADGIPTTSGGHQVEEGWNNGWFNITKLQKWDRMLFQLWQYTLLRLLVIWGELLTLCFAWSDLHWPLTSDLQSRCARCQGLTQTVQFSSLSLLPSHCLNPPAMPIPNATLLFFFCPNRKEALRRLKPSILLNSHCCSCSLNELGHVVAAAAAVLMLILVYGIGKLGEGV